MAFMDQEMDDEKNRFGDRAIILPNPQGKLPMSARVIDGYVQIDALAGEFNVSVSQLRKDIRTAQFKSYSFGGYQYIKRSELSELPGVLFKTEDDRRFRKQQSDKERRIIERELLSIARLLKQKEPSKYNQFATEVRNSNPNQQ